MHDNSGNDNKFMGRLDTDPLPDEIARRAAEIRATWDGEEEQKRREVQPLPWMVPAVIRGGALGSSGLTRTRPRHYAD